MTTVFDMETGKILEISRIPAAPNRTATNQSIDFGLTSPGLQEAVVDRPAIRIPPDLATLDIAEILARFR